MQPLVLSVNSYVVHGYVGNKCTVFTLEFNGIEVSPLNLIQLSNHRGYPVSKGSSLTHKELHDIFEDLDRNGTTEKLTHIITGYLTEEYEFKEIEHFLKKNPRICYYNGPKLGDVNGFYIPNDVLNYQKELIKYTDTLLLNSFEAEKISGMEIKDKNDVLDIVKRFHDIGINNIVIKNVIEDKFAFFSFKKGGKQFAIEIKDIDRSFTGESDIFDGLFLANSIKYPNKFEKIALNTINAIYNIVQKTKNLNLDEIVLPYSVDEILNITNKHTIIDLNDFLQID